MTWNCAFAVRMPFLHLKRLLHISLGHWGRTPSLLEKYAVALGPFLRPHGTRAIITVPTPGSSMLASTCTTTMLHCTPVLVATLSRPIPSPAVTGPSQSARRLHRSDDSVALISAFRTCWLAFASLWLVLHFCCPLCSLHGRWGRIPSLLEKVAAALGPRYLLHGSSTYPYLG